jgi:V/A-type H+/Na+-transporting ATPase subunit F
MNRLLVLTRPELLNGFRLAGVEAWAAEDVQSAMRQLAAWLETGEDCLLAVDESFLLKMDPAFTRRLESDEHALLIAIPSGEGLAEAVYQRNRIAELTRRAIGFHSIFKTEASEEEER